MLMEGIKILNQTEIVVKDIKLQTIFCILLLIGCVLFIISLVLEKFILSSIGITIGIISAIIITKTEPPKIPTGKYKYEVTIDKSVPMIEFYEKYEIIEQRGEIFIIKEKEKD